MHLPFRVLLRTLFIRSHRAVSRMAPRKAFSGSALGKLGFS